jgi:hypothetical protein
VRGRLTSNHITSFDLHGSCHSGLGNGCRWGSLRWAFVTDDDHHPEVLRVSFPLGFSSYWRTAHDEYPLGRQLKGKFHGLAKLIQRFFSVGFHL